MPDGLRDKKLQQEKIKVQVDSPQNYSSVQNFYKSVGYLHPLEADATVISASKNNQIIGIVRLAFEHGCVVLRGMQVEQPYQRFGIGSLMLKELEKQIGDRDCYCLLHGWLQSFYGQIGFKKISPIEAPTHLRQRFAENQKKYPLLIIMKRLSNASSG